MDRKRYLLKNLLLHFRPTRVPAKTLDFRLTWGLGGVAALLIISQIASGVLLTFAYEPQPVTAYDSILTIVNEIPFGRLIRNMHHWGANILVVVIFLHMLRVFFTGAFHPPRQFNWIIGIAMFGVVLFANFTGYLLPWDQLAFWAVTVSTGMLAYIPWIGKALQRLLLGGDALGPATLRMFYALHTSVVPLLLSGLMAFHFWRVRSAGGLVLPRSPGESLAKDISRVSTVPHLLLREITVAAVSVAVLVYTAVFVDAPLAAPANPGLSPNPTKAPWYFGGFQELLVHFDPVVAVFFIPLGLLVAALMLPYLRYPDDTGGIWFCSLNGRRTAPVAAIWAGLATFGLVLWDRLGGDGPLFSQLSPLISRGLVPGGMMLVLGTGLYLILKTRYTASRNETVQGVFVFILTAFLLLTGINIWFRGAGMQLLWPG